MTKSTWFISLLPKWKNLRLIVCMFIAFGCTKDNYLDSTVDKELEPFIISFLEEGKLRGKIFNLEDMKLNASITNVLDDNIAGNCAVYESGKKTITINTLNWKHSDKSKREFMVFHELGHCILNRSHNDTKDTNGVCNSIMHSSNQVCDFYYNANNRTQYLNELFDDKNQ